LFGITNGAILVRVVGVGQPANRVVVSPRRAIGDVDRYVFGGFIEHLGRCIYGGIYDEGSPLSDADGFRRDVLALLRELRVSVLRWPGGNFVSNYHWTDGIGPKDDRPARLELAWGDRESNRFGTDEFLRYCATVGADPYICLNMGTGTLAEALSWIEYCNSSQDTHWTRQRRANGREEPYNVRYWALGNEMYGEWQVGAMSAQEYVAEATRWARAIRMVDPSLRLVSCGLSGWDDWDRIVIDGLVSHVDLHSVHIYTGAADDLTNMLHAHQAERAVRSARALIERAAYLQRVRTPPKIAYDEWNVWYREDGSPLEERYNIADALAVGTYLNIFVRNSDVVRMANLAQMVNVIAPIVTTPETAVVQPIYYPILLHAQAALDTAVDVAVSGDVLDVVEGPSRWPHRVADLGPFTVLDAAATVSRSRDRVAVTVVNRSDDEARVEVALADGVFDGPVRVRTMTGDPEARVAPGIEAARVEEGSEKAADSRVLLTLPARSFTVVEANTGAI
jgi:alpha-N-arabinofuranosidase